MRAICHLGTEIVRKRLRIQASNLFQTKEGETLPQKSFFPHPLSQRRRHNIIRKILRTACKQRQNGSYAHCFLIIVRTEQATGMISTAYRGFSALPERFPWSKQLVFQSKQRCRIFEKEVSKNPKNWNFFETSIAFEPDKLRSF